MTSRPSSEVLFEIGDRVRIVTSESAYTGCRGTVARPPAIVPQGEVGLPLGYYVAVDGENGRLRPFLTGELERLRLARVRRPQSAPLPKSGRGFTGD